MQSVHHHSYEILAYVPQCKHCASRCLVGITEPVQPPCHSGRTTVALEGIFLRHGRFRDL
jgi:hypothetical protein